MDKLRTPFLFAALILMIILVLIELGSRFVIGDVDTGSSKPGLGISYLAIIDGLLLLSISLIASPLLITHRLHGRIQGIFTFFIALVFIIATIVMLITAIALLSLMVSLLVAVPFGTIAYMATFAHFPVGKATAALSIILLMKLLIASCLLLAQQAFLKNKGLMMLLFTSLLLTLLISFLHSFPPRFLVYITDDISAIITGVVGMIWALMFL